MPVLIYNIQYVSCLIYNICDMQKCLPESAIIENEKKSYYNFNRLENKTKKTINKQNKYTPD